VLRIGIVGCGKIADQHAEAIKRIRGCELAAVCDSEPLMARQMQDRFGVKGCFTDLDQFLSVSQPDVVHITTPPQSHFGLAKACLDAGCHVYIEKPLTVNTHEAELLVEKAEANALKLTVGHNAQFTHAARRMRKLISEGFLGGPPIHLESYYCSNLADPSYARAVLGDKDHWVRNLPGKLLHNIISHGISKIVPFLDAESPEVVVFGFTSPLLKRIGETAIIDELRVMVRDNVNTTAYFTFSSQIRPALHHLRVYGSRNSIAIDDDHETVIQFPGVKYRSYLDQFLPPIGFSGQYLMNAFSNIGKFLKRDFHMDSGMKFLIESLYQSVLSHAPVPIPYREIILTSKIMDSIFQQLLNLR